MYVKHSEGWIQDIYSSTMSGKSQFQQDETLVYDLSPRVLKSLQLMYFDSSTTEEVLPQSDKLTVESLQRLDRESSPKTLQPKDKDYYKSDLHRFNLKRDLKGLPRLTEEEFEELAGDLDESISGSESSETEDEEDKDDLYAYKKDKLETIFEKNVQQLENLKLQESERVVSHLATRSPYVLFKSDLLDQDKCFGVYKSLFSIKELEKPLEALQSWKSNSSTKKSALLMIGGGHFAGAIINHQPKSTKGNALKLGESILEQGVDIVAHKSFHRYTTRRKQGGAQSASDNSRGKANSAGSSLRRYNEVALQNEVRELLQSWKSHLDQCDSIFIRANGASNRNIIVGYEHAVLQNNDERIRSFPFTTKRATTSELKRAWVNLTYLNITDKPKIDEKKLKQKQHQEQIQQSKIQKEKETKEISEEEKHTTEVVGYLKKSRGPVLITYLRKHKLSPNFTLEPESEYYNTPTLLHFAAAHGIKNLIPILIKTAKADPSIQNPNGKTPYDLSANKQVRQAFQIARFEIGEDGQVDWEKAHVGKPVSREEVEELEVQEKNKEEQDKQKLIKEELAKAKEESRSVENGATKRLGGVSLAQANLSSLSDDQKMRLMREQRARAAEARMKQLNK